MPESDVQLPLLAEAGALKVSRSPFVVFELHGEPRAWGRAGARIARDKGGQQYIAFYVGFEEKQYRDALAWCAKAAMRGKPPTERPVALLMHAFMAIPASWTPREKMDARSGARVPDGKPDWDNLGKITDALKGVVWVDDCQVVDGRVIKRFSEQPALRVEVREFG